MSGNTSNPAASRTIPAKVRSGFASGIVTKQIDRAFSRFKEKRKCSSWLVPSIRGVSIIAGCAAGALILNFLLFSAAGLPFVWTGIASAVVLALTIATPLLVYGIRREREFATMKSMLNQISSADHLTSCLDGAVFTALVDTFRAAAEGKPGPRQGALLVIDVDHFRGVNARFGRSWGDEVLRVIAEVIRNSVRSGDLVGRLGGEEFGIFLPGATIENSKDVAERVREVIAGTLFEPGGKRCLLTVSVGGIAFEDQLIFDDLVEAAEEQLLLAKAKGRNRTSISTIVAKPLSLGRIASPPL